MTRSPPRACASASSIMRRSTAPPSRAGSGKWEGPTWTIIAPGPPSMRATAIAQSQGTNARNVSGNHEVDAVAS